MVYRGSLAICKRLGYKCRNMIYPLVARGLPAIQASPDGMWILDEMLLRAWLVQRSRVDRKTKPPKGLSNQHKGIPKSGKRNPLKGKDGVLSSSLVRSEKKRVEERGEAELRDKAELRPDEDFIGP